MSPEFCCILFSQKYNYFHVHVDLHWNYSVADDVHFVISYHFFFFISEEEEVDKMMEQKLKEEEERKRKKEMEERMSLEETKEQVRLYDCCILMLGLFTNGVVIMSQES